MFSDNTLIALGFLAALGMLALFPFVLGGAVREQRRRIWAADTGSDDGNGD